MPTLSEKKLYNFGELALSAHEYIVCKLTVAAINKLSLKFNWLLMSATVQTGCRYIYTYRRLQKGEWTLHR